MNHAVEAEGLSKSYRIRVPGRDGMRTVERTALRDVSFRVAPGEVLGIIGPNGAGKSTLLKILARVVAPTAGRAVIRGRVGALLEVGTGMHPEMTGRENVFLNGALLGMKRADVLARFDAIAEFAGIGDYLDTPIKRYSSGMRLRLAFSVAAHLAADVMIVDEVLAVGDAEFQSRCLGRIRQGVRGGRATLFVSHNMAAVTHLCDRVLRLEGGEVRADGDPAEVVTDYLSGVAGASTGRREFPEDPEKAGAAAVFLSASATGEDGGAPLQGGDLLLRADLLVRRRIPRLQVRFGIDTPEGQRVLDQCKGDVGGEFDLAPGRWTVTAHLSSPRLLPRDYLLRLAAVEDWGRERHDEIAPALSFTVQGADVLGHGILLKPDRGITWAPAAYAVAPAPVPPGSR